MVIVIYRSKCCGARVKIEGMPDFIGSKEVCTVNAVCCHCEKPCDTTRFNIAKKRKRKGSK